MTGAWPFGAGIGFGVQVLKAMGLPHARTLGSIRFSLGAANTQADIDGVIEALPPIVDDDGAEGSDEPGEPGPT